MPEAISIAAPAPAKEGPSALYRGGSWKIALAASQALPLRLAQTTAKLACHLYRIGSPRRRQIIFENLLPIFNDDWAATSRAAHRLFAFFLADGAGRAGGAKPLGLA